MLSPLPYILHWAYHSDLGQEHNIHRMHNYHYNSSIILLTINTFIWDIPNIILQR